MARFTKPQLEQLIIDYANGYGIDPAVAVVQLKRESANYRDDVVYGPFVGGAGERGVSQFTPGTWATWGNGPHTNAYEPEYALTAWGAYMTYLLNLFNWDYSKALTGYNGGEGYLTNPSRFGGPSQAALRYASEILAKAGTVIPVSNGDGVAACFEGDPCFVDYGAGDYLKDFFSGANPAGSNTSKFLLIGGLALVAVLVLKR